MSDDILDRIDSAVSEAERAERWSKRFDPFGADDWDEDRVDRWGDGMRVRPAGAGIEEEAVPAEAARIAVHLGTEFAGNLAGEPPVRWVQIGTSPWASFTVGDHVPVTMPAPGPVTYVVQATNPQRNRGRAPHDRVADAFREEVLRQGLSECEIDGMREIYEDGAWRPAADVRAMTPEEAEAFEIQQRRSLECFRFNPLCSGCDGQAIDGGSCLHECHRAGLCANRIEAFFGEVLFCDLQAGHEGCHRCEATAWGSIDDLIPERPERAPWWRRIWRSR